MLKYRVNNLYLGYHYVWCSTTFEAGAVAASSIGSSQPPSSDPATIYRRLHQDVRQKDRHANEIQRQRESIKAAAMLVASQGQISPDIAADIAEMVEAADLTDFRPVLYAIPYGPVADRVQLVPVAKRASLAPEYIIPDLHVGEFDMIEPYPCH